MQIICALLCSHMWSLGSRKSFPTFFHNRHDMRKQKLLYFKYIFRIPLKLFETFLNIRDIQRCNIIMHKCVHMKCPVLLLDLDETWVTSTNFRKILKCHIMKIWSVGDELDDTDRQTDMTKLLATCRKLQTRLIHESYEALYHASVSKPPPHVTCYFQIFSPAHH